MSARVLAAAWGLVAACGGGAATFRGDAAGFHGPVAESTRTISFPSPGDRWAVRVNKAAGVAWVLAPKTNEPGAWAAPPDGLLFLAPTGRRPEYWDCVAEGRLDACLVTTITVDDFTQVALSSKPERGEVAAGAVFSATFVGARGRARFAGDVHLILADRSTGLVAIVIGAGDSSDALEAARTAARALRDGVRFAP